MGDKTQRRLAGIFVVLAVWQAVVGALYTIGWVPGTAPLTPTGPHVTLIEPAPITFALWWVVYAAMLLLAVYQVRPTRIDDPTLVALRIPLLIGFTLNGLWVLALATNERVLAQAILFALTATLAIAYLRLARLGRPRSQHERVIVYTTVGGYLGMVAASAVIGLGQTLVAEGYGDLGVPSEVAAAVALVVLGAIVVLTTLAGPPEPGLPLVVIAVVVGIALRDPAPPLAVSIAAGAVSAATVGAVLARGLRWSRRGGALASLEEVAIRA